jgi:hypothetical protein
MHHLRLTVQEKLQVDEMIIELFILKVKVQTFRHGDLTWPKMKRIQFVMLTSSSVTTSSSYGEMSERNPA